MWDMDLKWQMEDVFHNLKTLAALWVNFPKIQTVWSLLSA